MSDLTEQPEIFVPEDEGDAPTDDNTYRSVSTIKKNYMPINAFESWRKEVLKEFKKLMHLSEIRKRIDDVIPVGKSEQEKWASTDFIAISEVEKMIPLYESGHCDSEFKYHERIGRNAVLKEMRASLEQYKVQVECKNCRPAPEKHILVNDDGSCSSCGRKLAGGTGE